MSDLPSELFTPDRLTDTPSNSTTRLLQAPLDLTTVQAGVLQPEAFQASLIQNISGALLRSPSAPCLLRAPTGSGKTFVMGQVLQNVGAERAVLWFWFVPFVTLVNQTLDSLVVQASGLSPVPFAQGRNQDVSAGTVLVSTAQAVARAQWRTKGYDADGNDEVRTLAALVARARTKGLQIGLVVDEAHIGLDQGTEFGKFAHWLQADYLLMATATPKDQRLLEFLGHAGYSAHEQFSVSRSDVVKARLNKQYIEAVVYHLGAHMQQVTDLRRTVLRQAWGRNLLIGRQLAAHGIACEPLLLVQVANGAHTVEEAAQELMRHCHVPPEAIGQHSADAPDPGLMAAIANDATKQALIFKQSAGTGFDAPRAFVLASLKPVNDADFAMQFIGRVMRVARQVRGAFARPTPIAADLNTAYVYLGNAEAQAGFEAAVEAISAIKSELEGWTARMTIRKTIAGGVVISSRPTAEQPLDYRFGLPDSALPNAGVHAQAPPEFSPGAAPEPTGAMAPYGQDLFGNLPWQLDAAEPAPPTAKATKPDAPKTREEVLKALQDNGLQAFARKTHLPTLGAALKTEERPQWVDLDDIPLQAAQSLPISPVLAQTAAKVALHRMTQKEQHTELTQGGSYAQEIQVITDRNALAKEAMTALQELPHAEEADYRIIMQTLSTRLRPALDAELTQNPPDQALSEQDLVRLTRDAAHWVIRSHAQELREIFFQGIANKAVVEDAKPLPDLMIFPQDIRLERSAKNIYGVLPPSAQQAQMVDDVLFMDQRQWWIDQAFAVENSTPLTIARYDGAAKLNALEMAFAHALDDADFVLWWHRNPDKKPYSVKVVRAEHGHYFYPDFVVCVAHAPGEAPMQRLIETKADTKDAARKAQRFPKIYGKVLFLTPDGSNERLRWINDDGSLGEVVRLTELSAIREKLRVSKPTFDDL